MVTRLDREIDEILGNDENTVTGGGWRRSGGSWTLRDACPPMRKLVSPGRPSRPMYATPELLEALQDVLHEFSFRSWVTENPHVAVRIDSPRAKKVRAATEQFLKLVRGIDSVEAAWLVDDGKTPVLWTVISAERFDDSARSPVYDAQLNVLRSLDEPLVTFRLINRRETPSDDWERMLESKGKLLWRR